MSQTPKPRLQALVLADYIYMDERTKKKVIAGTFNRLWSSEFPATLSRITKAYVVLTNCHGVQRLQIRYVDLKDESVLLESPEVQLSIEDPLAVNEVVMDVPPFPMPHEGSYAFEVYCNGDFLGDLRLNVGKAESPKE